jgi:hypothetical protein
VKRVDRRSREGYKGLAQRCEESFGDRPRVKGTNGDAALIEGGA